MRICLLYCGWNICLAQPNYLPIARLTFNIPNLSSRTPYPYDLVSDVFDKVFLLEKLSQSNAWQEHKEETKDLTKLEHFTNPNFHHMLH